MTRRVFWTIEISALVLLAFFIFVEPSIYSTKAHLSKNITSFNVGGYYSPSADEIVILAENNTFWYYIVLRHEECHRTQNYAGRLSVGNVSIFWDEIECNFKQYAGVYDYFKEGAWKKKESTN